MITTKNSFEFDASKSQSNLEKHGIDFVEAQELWKDEDVVEGPVRSDDEPRFMVIGRIKGKFWSAFVTYRNENIRIISVRRARAHEEALYESSRIRQEV